MSSRCDNGHIVTEWPCKSLISRDRALNSAEVGLANDGVAGIPGVLRVFVESPDGKVKIGGGLDPGHPYAGKLRQASFILPKGLDGQKMLLRAEVETKGGIRKPVRWACTEPVNPDGSFSFQLRGGDTA